MCLSRSFQQGLPSHSSRWVYESPATLHYYYIWKPDTILLQWKLFRSCDKLSVNEIVVNRHITWFWCPFSPRAQLQFNYKRWNSHPRVRIRRRVPANYRVVKSCNRVAELKIKCKKMFSSFLLKPLARILCLHVRRYVSYKKNSPRKFIGYLHVNCSRTSPLVSKYFHWMGNLISV